MGISRRKFLELCAAGTCGGLAHQMYSAFSPMRAFATPLQLPLNGAFKNLVVCSFNGGASHNTANPLCSAYLNLCPDISYTEATGGHHLDGHQVLHPALAYFKTLFDAGDLAICNLTGYHDPNYSHDDSTNIMELGRRYGSQADGGWGAKLACQIATLFPGVSLGGNPLLMQGACMPGDPGSAPTSIGNIDNFGIGNVQYDEDKTTWVNMTINNMLAAGGLNGPAFAYVQSENLKYQNIVTTVQEATSGLTSPYFNGLNSGIAQQFEDASRLIRASSLGVRVLRVGLGGFDTHSGERNQLTNLMTDLNEAVEAFARTLIDANLWNDTVILFISEFCRTFQNNNQGTDHGHSGPCFVAGGPVNGRVVNEAPNDAVVTAAANSSYRFENYDIHYWTIYRELISAMGLPADIIESPVGGVANIGLIA